MTIRAKKEYDQHAHEQPTQASDWAAEHRDSKVWSRDTGQHSRGDVRLPERPAESYAPPSGWVDRTNRGTDSDPRIDSNIFPSDKE